MLGKRQCGGTKGEYLGTARDSYGTDYESGSNISFVIVKCFDYGRYMLSTSTSELMDKISCFIDPGWLEKRASKATN